MKRLLRIINIIRANKGLPKISEARPEMRLREDIGLESLDLAELTVRIENEFDVDVFADDLVFTIGEVAARISAVEHRNNDDCQ